MGIAAAGALGIGGASLVIAAVAATARSSSPCRTVISMVACLAWPQARESALSRDEFRMCGLGV
jgi:hypothetical protein